MENLGVEGMFARTAAQRLHVFGKARTAIATPGINKLIADAGVGTDAAPHFLDVGPQAFGEQGNLVHEADLGRQHRIGRVLGEFRRPHIHDDHALMVAGEGIIERLQ